MSPGDQVLVLRFTLFLILPTLFASLAATYNLKWRQHVQTIMALANAISGLVSTYLCFAFATPLPDVAMGLVITTAFFAFTIFRLEPIRAFAAVATYFVVFVLLLARLASVGPVHLGTVQLVAYLVIAINAVGVGAFSCVVMNAVSRENFRNEQTIERQHHALEHERARSERLLGSILPAAVAERLKGEPGLIADQYNYATVIFADLVGFTELATRLKPKALVTLLNQVFSKFDELAAQHGAEKIKTIGDAYMAVVGVPTERVDHAVAAAHFALALLAAIEAHSAQTGDKLLLRIGLSSGALVAGVVGTTRFAYDLWGDTVNVASRMESLGLEGRIQVCEKTHALLQDHFRFEDRGEIDVRGKGTMRTYWLLEAL